MDFLTLLLELGYKTLLGVLAVFGVWLAVAVPTALLVGRMITRADDDMPVITEDCDECADAGVNR